MLPKASAISWQGYLDVQNVVLCLSPSGGDEEIFLQVPWSHYWTEVTREAPEEIERRFGGFVHLKAGMAVPHFAGTEVTLWVEDIDQLEHARSNKACKTVIFAPVHAAALDALGQQRRGLVAKVNLMAGHTLTDEDMIAVPGSLGVAEAMRPSILGRRLCYDLRPGEPITFGMISHESGRS